MGKFCYFPQTEEDIRVMLGRIGVDNLDSLYSDVPELCKSSTLDEIRAHGYSLAPSKYIEFIDHDLDIDYEKEMARIQSEMREVMKAEKQSQAMLEEAFRGIGYGID